MAHCSSTPCFRPFDYFPSSHISMGDIMEHFVSDNIKLMIIDNDQVFLKEARIMFSSCNYRVTTCASPLCALKILRERGAEFNLLAVEVHMQEMGGFELINMIRKEFDLQFIMISADARMEIIKTSIELGACFFVKKPLDFNTVENLWQHVLSFKKHPKRESIKCIRDRDQFHHTNQAALTGEDAKENEHVDDTSKQAVNKECMEYCNKSKSGTAEGEQEIESEDDSSSKPKKKAINWCSFLQQKFLDALEILGDDAVPSKIVRLMNVEGISRQQVASHLQKYRKKKGSNTTFTPIYCAQNIQASNFTNQIPNQLGQHGMHQIYLSNYNQQYLQGVVTQITPVYAQIPLSFNTYPYANMCYLENVQLNGYATANPTQVQQFGMMSQPPIPPTNNVSTIGETSTQPVAYEPGNSSAFHYGDQTFQDHAPNYDDLVANEGEFSTHEPSKCEVGQQYFYGSNNNNNNNNNNNMVENFEKTVENDDFGDIEKFAYGDDPWLSVLQDVMEGSLDLDISDV